MAPAGEPSITTASRRASILAELGLFPSPAAAPSGATGTAAPLPGAATAATAATATATATAAGPSAADAALYEHQRQRMAVLREAVSSWVHQHTRSRDGVRVVARIKGKEHSCVFFFFSRSRAYCRCVGGSSLYARGCVSAQEGFLSQKYLLLGCSRQARRAVQANPPLPPYSLSGCPRRKRHPR